MWKKDSSEKIYSDFLIILHVLFYGINQNNRLLFFHAKNRNKHVKTPKNYVFSIFRLNFDNFQNWIQMFDDIFGELSYAVFRREKFLLLPEIFWKKLKNSYIIKADISRKLWLGSFSNFDKPQFIKLVHFHCL